MVREPTEPRLSVQIALALSVAACGYDEIAATQAIEIPQVPRDANVDAVPFSDLRRLIELGDPELDQEDPTLTGDELELYFSAPGPRRDKAAGDAPSHLLVSKRAKTSDPWGTPTEVVGLNGSFTSYAPTTSSDGLSIWFASDMPGGQGGMDIWTSSRSSRDAGWDLPRNVAEISTSGWELDPGVSQDLRILYFGRFGADNRNHLWGTSRALPTDSWDAPHEISELNSPASDGSPSHDGDPAFSNNGLSLYWGSSRDVVGGNAIAHLDRASRPSILAGFGGVTPLTEINSSSDDQDPWVSADDRHIVFSSDREGPGYHHLYEAWRR